MNSEEYSLIITEKMTPYNMENYTYRTSVFSYADGIYWAKRAIELGSKGVTLWQNLNLIDVFYPEPKETKQ